MTLRSLHLGPVNLSKGRPSSSGSPFPDDPFFFFSPSPPLALFLQRKDAMLANREKIQFWSFYLFLFMLLLFIGLFIVSANFSHLLFGENVWRNPFEGFGGRKISIFFRYLKFEGLGEILFSFFFVKDMCYSVIKIETSVSGDWYCYQWSWTI